LLTSQSFARTTGSPRVIGEIVVTE
jgi:hypothetical protein